MDDYDFAEANRPTGEKKVMARWEMRVAFGQVVLLWVVVALVMILVFVFGFKAGTKHGLAVALEDYGDRAVRLPVVQPVRKPDDGSVGTSISAPIALSEGPKIPVQLALEGESVPQDEVIEKPEVAEPSAEFDFSAIKKIVTEAKASPEATPVEPDVPGQTAEDHSAGLNTRPTAELLQGSSSSEREERTEIRQARKERSEEISSKITKKPKVPRVPTPGKPPPQKPTTKGLASGWYVQVSATRSESEAAALARQFSELDIPAMVERAKVHQRTYYRILLGPYGMKESAQAARDRAKKTRMVRDEPFLKHVK